MIFKADWEKATLHHQLPNGAIEQMVKMALPNEKLDSYQIIAGGCANINIKIKLVNQQKALLLRIYLRDKDAIFREQKLGALLHQIVPVPLINYIGEFADYNFAIIAFLPGITLRELLISEIHYDLTILMNEVGKILAKINSFKFDKAGFFDKDLNVAHQISNEIYIDYIEKCLANSFVRSQLCNDIVSEIRLMFKKYSGLLPVNNESNLTHGDFDPANFLVDMIDGEWRVTGILDWEFAFSGSVLFDIANMLRYSHQMPADFQASFLSGIKSGGIILPKHWQITIKLLNIGSLLDILSRSDSQNRPIQCVDVNALIEHILKN